MGPFFLKGRVIVAMFYRLGRLLQLAGLIILPVAISGNVANPERVNLRTSLALSAAGVLIFLIGWLVQQAGRRR
jgi:hypothetical protein